MTAWVTWTGWTYARVRPDGVAIIVEEPMRCVLTKQTHGRKCYYGEKRRPVLGGPNLLETTGEVISEVWWGDRSDAKIFDREELAIGRANELGAGVLVERA